MTEAEFLALEPRERNALVAEKVMGLPGLAWPADYTTTWEGAGLVVERGILESLGWNAYWKAWDCFFTIDNISGEARADTASLAISIAALKAKGVIE